MTSLHDPLQLASAVTAVDRLSHGRLDLGIAAGGGSRRFAAFGVDVATHVRYFTEGLALMKAAWSDRPRVKFHGRFRDVDDLPIAPKPVQRPHPPIWFGGRAPTALARAVRHGDAFLGAGSSTTADFAQAVTVVRRELAEQHKDPATFTIGKRVYLMVDDDGDRAREGCSTGYAPSTAVGCPASIRWQWRARPMTSSGAERSDRRRSRDAAAQSGGHRRRAEPRPDGTPCRRGGSAPGLAAPADTESHSGMRIGAIVCLLAGL
ncbi:hypothetical protein NIIDMKKI_62870 [Mycobacterium kansasii]|uniref:Luciferase-like domain-containing protein n=1 Tax=Mycobacterium kansasii TaxID=1768 RepID=A0A7G1IJ83_MYCKA|nr:hypothetical protein NIIDMKKI_62870 [Mycobacterium kansasii]